ncbi:putative Acriflavine resistance protein acrA [Candidatus Zixiibacteriota bacterium]|nr:putative Acriflavine resistance protein acrA [candidate division Zixibacteria bacterium]
MKTKSKVIIAMIPLFIIAIAVLKISQSSAKGEVRRQNAPLVKIEQPRTETVVKSLQLTGDILPIQQAQVFAKVYGNLEAVYVNMGDFVRVNQMLAQIDTTVLSQQYNQALANYQKAQDDYNRTKALRDKSLVAQQDLDYATTALKVAQANYDASKTQLDYARITAPFSGFITRRYFDPGAVLTATNATLFNLMDLDRVKVIVNVLEKDVPLIKIGEEAVVKVDAFPGREFEGTVVRQSEAVDPNTRTMAVEVDIPNHEYILKPGMFAAVSLIINKQENALTVPTQAVFQDALGSYIFVADSSTAHRRDIEAGLEHDSRTEILSGLTGDDQIIVVGQQFVRDGGPIKIQP